MGEIGRAKDMARKLVEDDDFYDECMKTTKELYDKLYTEDKFVEHFNRIFGSLK